MGEGQRRQFIKREREEILGFVYYGGEKWREVRARPDTPWGGVIGTEGGTCLSPDSPLASASVAGLRTTPTKGHPPKLTPPSWAQCSEKGPFSMRQQASAQGSSSLAISTLPEKGWKNWGSC